MVKAGAAQPCRWWSQGEEIACHPGPSRSLDMLQPLLLLPHKPLPHLLWRRQPGWRRLHPVTMFSDPSSSLYWPPDVARYNMEALLFLSSGWLRTACVVAALFWYEQMSPEYNYM